LNGSGRKAIVVGCGQGADAEHAAALGFDTVAFDIAPTAVRQAAETHPASTVRYVVANLFALPPDWLRAFDLVIEIITVQALPDHLRRQAIINVSSLVAVGGTLFVLAWRKVDGAPPPPPWPLDRAEIDAFASEGLTSVHIEELNSPGERFEPRWRAEFRRDSPESKPSR
jgi:SAM-dependent methyltransferase